MALGSSTSRRNLRRVSTMWRCSSLSRKSTGGLLSEAREGVRLAPLRLLDQPCPREHDLRTADDGDVDHLAVEVDRRRPAREALPERRDDPPRVLDGGGIGGEHAVEHGDLIGVDAPSALAAELP